MSEDEFDLYDLPEFTEDDFARIDAAVELKMAEDKGGGGLPKVTVQLEQPVVDIDLKATTTATTTTTKSTPVKELSPFDRFRANGILSVSDLVAPVW
jgi:exonuclease V